MLNTNALFIILSNNTITLSGVDSPEGSVLVEDTRLFIGRRWFRSDPTEFNELLEELQDTLHSFGRTFEVREAA